MGNLGVEMMDDRNRRPKGGGFSAFIDLPGLFWYILSRSGTRILSV